MNNLVSVLMCVYNTPIEYLKEAVGSILGQNYDNIEFIIIDDSSDKRDVIDYLNCVQNNDSRVQLFHNEVNQGLTKSLNIGLTHCRGKYIARMDSDDISLPTRIPKQVEYMETHPDVALVGSHIISFGEGMEEIDSSAEPDRCDDPEIYRICSLFGHSGPPHPTFLFRTSYLKDNNISYREDIFKAQDYGIMADILKAGGIIRKINEPLLKYRVHKDQITSINEVEQKAYQCRVSYDCFRTIFPILTDLECTALSLLGCSAPWDDLLEEIESNIRLCNTCRYIVKNKTILETPGFFIDTIKKCIRYNRQNGLYDKSKFTDEIRCLWWKKSLRTSQYRHRVWGMSFFTLCSYIYVLKRRVIWAYEQY